MSSLIFTHHSGKVFEITSEEVSNPSSPNPLTLFDSSSAIDNMDQTQLLLVSLDLPSLPLVTVSDLSNAANETTRSRRSKKSGIRKKRSVSDQTGNDSATQTPELHFIYNDYGELLNLEKMKSSVNSGDLTVTETLRLILKAYHYEFRKRMGLIMALQPNEDVAVGDECALATSGFLFLWNFTPKTPDELPPDESQYLYVYRGPPKVLDIGCGDGSWCFKVKEAHPDWIVQGLDEMEYWSKVKPGLIFRDFMEFNDAKETNRCFKKVHTAQSGVEFTVRNINTLLFHLNPIPCHIYSFIRARDVFSRLESYKGFLEDVRRVLQPEGVVEFIEIDPRPRVALARRRRSVNEGHVSRLQTDWTDNIVDRFKDPYDEQLASMVPGWMQRVEERLKASLRPRDGIPAVHLKSWLEGAGFWDVKQLIIRLPVGGDSPTGKLLLEFMKYQTDLENHVPLLATNIPCPNFDEISFGNFYINMHVVTGRKPRDPRPGNMLRDGTRQGMTTSSHGASNGVGTQSTNQWTRAYLDAGLVTMIKSQMINNLSTMTDTHERLSLSSMREKSERASQ